MEGNSLRIIIIGILATSMLMWGCPLFLHEDGIHVALAHHFFHANIFHLAVNSLSVWLLFRKGYRYEITPLIVAFICATISWYCSTADVVGFSNIIFATVGLRTPSLTHSWWRQPATPSLSAIRVVLSAYLRLLIFLLAMLIPACASSSLAFCMMYSACKLNKQGDNIVLTYSSPYLEPVCCSMSSSNCCFLTCIQIS